MKNIVNRYDVMRYDMSDDFGNIALSCEIRDDI